MKYPKILFLLCTMLIVFSGCRSKSTEPVVQNIEVTTPDRTSQDVVLDRSNQLPTNTGNLGAGTQNGQSVKQQVGSEDSVLKKAGDYRNITFINIDDWVEYFNAELGIRLLYPRQYVIAEEGLGYYLLTGGEGVGDFYTISIQDEKNTSVESYTLLRSQQVTINGITYELEEYQTEIDSVYVSYVTQHLGKWYRFTYEYFSGFEDELDLFTQAVEQIQLF